MKGDGANAIEMSLLDLDSEILETTLAESRFALVEFWAEWCLFSRLLYPKSRRLAGRYGERLLVARCHLDGGEAVIDRIGVRYLPAVMLFRGQKPLRRWYGDTPERLFVRAIESLTESANA